MAEGAQRLASLIVVGGPLDGRRYDLEEVVTEVLVGSDPDCHLHVDVEGVSPIHARLWTELNGAVAHETRAPGGLYVNEQKVDDQAPLREGDSLWLGPPGVPGSVHVVCRFEPWVEVLPEVPVEPEAAPTSDADEAPLPLATVGADEAFELDLGPGGAQASPPSPEPPPAKGSLPESRPVPGEAEAPVPDESLEAFSFEPPTPSEPRGPGPEGASFVEPEPTPPVPAEPPPGQDRSVSTSGPAPPAADASAPDLGPVQLGEDVFMSTEPSTPVAEPRAPGAEPAPPGAEGLPRGGEPSTPRAEAGPESQSLVDDALFVEAEPLAPGAEPGAADAEPATPAYGGAAESGPLDDDALFVEAELPASEAPESPAGGKASEATPESAPLAGTPAEDDPFFVGEPSPPVSRAPAAPPAAEDDAWAIASPEVPVAAPSGPPPPVSAPQAERTESRAEEEYFIAEEVPAEEAPPAPAAPAEDAPFAEAEEVALPAPGGPGRAPLPPRKPAPPPAPGSGTPRSAGAAAPPQAPPIGGSPAAGGPVSTTEAPPAAEARSPASAGALPPQAPPGTPGPSRGSPEAPVRDPGAAPARPAPRSAGRPRPAARRAAPAGVRRSGRRRPERGVPEWVRPVALGAGLAVALGVVGFGLVWWLGRTVSVEAISPTRVRVGQSAVITGSGFSSSATENTVLFGGARATILSASKTRIEVEVPEAVVEAGAERRVPVVVRSGSLESEPVEISVFQGPRLHGLSPDVALPGEEVLLAGAGWGIGATVRFGTVEAEILEIDPTRIRVTVPQLPGGYGASAPVVVTVGGVESNPAPFFMGRVPLVTSVSPQTVSVGDVLTISGRGFERDANLNDVRVGGVPALVVSASAEKLDVVVPRQAAGDPTRPIEVRLPGLADVGRGVVTVTASRDPVGLRFVAEPFAGPSAHPHGVLATDLGPVFVLAASGGRSAAQRALAAQQALNAAIPTLARAPGVTIESRDLETSPALGLSGSSEALLEITPEDAAAYNEDWTRLRGRGRPVTPSRLARWWEVVARDLVRVLLRGEPPQFAAALAPEGRVFQKVYDAARRAGGPPVSRQMIDDLPASVRDGLRIVAQRVPVSVTEDSRPGAGAAAATAAGEVPESRPRDLELEGTWTGSENEQGTRRLLTVTFHRDYGSIAYEGGITYEVPFLKLERLGRDGVRFTVQVRGGIRHYHGSWDGETLSGDISRDEAGSDVVGRFELRPR